MSTSELKIAAKAVGRSLASASYLWTNRKPALLRQEQSRVSGFWRLNQAWAGAGMGTSKNVIPPPMIPLPVEAARKWYAIYVLSNHEKRVEEHLGMKEVEVFLPVSTVTRRWKNRTTAKLKIPLFPGYVFAHISPTERVRVLEAPSVLWIVGTGKEPLPLPDNEIEILRSGLHLRQVDPYPYLKIGERTRIRSGPFAGMEGIVVRKDDRLRVVLSIDLIRQSIAVHVEADELEPCNNWRPATPSHQGPPPFRSAS